MRAVFPWLDFARAAGECVTRVGRILTTRHRQFREAVDRAVYREVLRLNLLDFRLLRAARAEVRRRLTLVPTAPTLDSADHRAQPLHQGQAGCRGPCAGKTNASAVKASSTREFYLEKYPDVRAAGLDPLRHYVEHGASEGRKPHRLFDPAYYLRQRPRPRGRSGSADRFPGRRGARCQSASALRLRRRRAAAWWTTLRRNIWRSQARTSIVDFR